MASIARAVDPEQLAAVRELLLEYAASLEVDLAFQDFRQEVESLPGEYVAPRGCLLLALAEAGPIGCVGVRPLDPDRCEMKRLYVRPQARGTGLGHRLAVAAIDFGRSAGFRAMRLDTLPSMRSAQSLYRLIGFKEIAAYRSSPVAGNLFMELEL